MTTCEKPVSRPAEGLVVHAEGQTGGTGVLPVAVEQTIPAHLLDGGEIVHFAIKPSPWFVLLVSLRWVIAGIVLMALSMMDEVPIPFSSKWYLYHIGLWMAAGRLAWGLIEWVSRLYVLTNRRVMRIRGIFSVEVFTCPLDRVKNTALTISVAERMTRTGTVAFQTSASAGGATGAAAWRIVARPIEVHEQLREAIRRAQNRGQNGL